MKAALSILAFLVLQTILFAQQRACDSTFADTDGVTVHTCVDNEPSLPGEKQGYLDFINNNIQYPKEALENNTNGNVWVRVIITEKGKLKSATVVAPLKGKGAEACSNEALRLLNLIQNWSPATIAGKPVRYIMKIPVKFQLQKQETLKIVELDSDYSDPVAPPPPGMDDVGDYPPPPPPPPPFEGDYAPAPPQVEVSDTSVFTIVDQMPEFPGWEYGLMKYINESIQYPKNSGDSQGTVFVQFIVERDGSVSHAKVRSSFSGPYSAAFDTEALRVINSLPKFTPGMHNGKPVRVMYMLPVIFKLR